MAEAKSNADLDLTEVSRDAANSTLTQTGDPSKGEAISVQEQLGKPKAASSSSSSTGGSKLKSTSK